MTIFFPLHNWFFFLFFLFFSFFLVFSSCPVYSTALWVFLFLWRICRYSYKLAYRFLLAELQTSIFYFRTYTYNADYCYYS